MIISKRRAATSFILPAISLLVGCGGGASTAPFTPQSFEADFESNVGETLLDYRYSPVEPGTLEGNATFNGMLLLPTDPQADKGLVGRIQLSADFDEETLTGFADQFGLYDLNFQDTTRFSDAFTKAEDLDGQLNVSDGFTGTVNVGDLSAHTMHGDLDGALTGSTGTYTVDTFFAGVVSNATTGEGLVSNGELIGTIVTPDRSISYGRESGIGGAFVVYSD